MAATDKQATETDLQKKVEDLTNDVSNLTALLKKSIEHSASNLAENADGKVQQLRDNARQAGKQVRDFLHDGSGRVAKLRDECEASISNNPFKAVAIAAMSGAALAYFLRR